VLGGLGRLFVFELFEQLGGVFGRQAREDVFLVVGGQVGEGVGLVGGVEGGELGNGVVDLADFERGPDAVEHAVDGFLLHAHLQKARPRSTEVERGRREAGTP
jgi:hypothetical protein